MPEFLDHSVPTLIIAGQNEVNDLPDYDGLLGQDQYYNTPETTTKLLYEIGGGGHSSTEWPGGSEGIPGRLALNWLNYFIQNKEEYCDSVLIVPDNACLLYTSPSPRDGLLSRMPSSA